MLSPEDKNRFDALMRLSDFAFQRWQDRRKYEWRLSLGLWALIAASIHYRDVVKPSSPHNCAVALMLIVVVFVHACWIRSNWVSNQKDINNAFYYSDNARQLLQGQEMPRPDEAQGPAGTWRGLKEEQSKCLAFLQAPPCQAELGATAILVLILGYFMWA